MLPLLSTNQTQQQWDKSTECSSTESILKKSVRRTSRRRCLSVAFSPNIGVKEVPQLKDVTQEEKSAVWYAAEDYEQIKKSLIVTIRLMMAKKPMSSDHCTRGLEFRAPAGAKLRKTNKIDALTAVWNEQVKQWKDDRTDEEAISRVYQQQTQKSSMSARKMGLHDEMAVEQSLWNGGDSLSSLSLGSISSETNQKQIKPLEKQLCGPAAA
jgi:hypothetical protein